MTIILTDRTDSRRISGRDKTCPTVSSSMVGLPMATARPQDHRVPAGGYRGQKLFPHFQRAGMLAELARTSACARRRYPDGVIFALDACRCLRLPVARCQMRQFSIVPNYSISASYIYLYYILHLNAFLKQQHVLIYLCTQSIIVHIEPTSSSSAVIKDNIEI